MLRAPRRGGFQTELVIGDAVKKGQVAARVEDAGIRAGVDGVVRGLLRSGNTVRAGQKVGDIDPRGERGHCFAISDRARAIGGGVLEAIQAWVAEKRREA